MRIADSVRLCATLPFSAAPPTSFCRANLWRNCCRAIGKAVSSHQLWVGWVSTPPDRLFAKLREKADAYSSLAAELRLPYVIAPFGEFTAPIEPYEVHYVLHELHGGVFAAVPALAGALFFRERLGEYEYHHFTTSHATLTSQIIRRS